MTRLFYRHTFLMFSLIVIALMLAVNFMTTEPVVNTYSLVLTVDHNDYVIDHDLSLLDCVDSMNDMPHTACELEKD